MKRIALAAFTGLAALALTAAPSEAIGPHWLAKVQPACPSAPAVARTYLAAQAGKKLTMTRAAIIAEITRLTGPDASFAGLTPCQAGYPNAVRFWIDEVLKVGTNNSP
ncbi:MAG: hypothetical protein ACREMS_04030 [Gemmatimonadaceae bacterium]